jgi:cytochrome P450
VSYLKSFVFLMLICISACSLSWLFYELSNNPEVVAKLRHEIRNTVGMHKDPEYSDLKSMKYLQVYFPRLLALRIAHS